MTKKKKKAEYNAESIQVLEGLEAVRVRPGMYVGGTGKAGMHHLIWEIVDNSVDEANAGFADKIRITLNGNTVTVEDNGRGVPCGKHPKMGIPTIDVVFTKLHAGGKFDNSAYKTAGGLHGVGSAVTNALSSDMTVVVYRDRKEYVRKYSRGKICGKLKTTNVKRNRTGTKVTFTPDSDIFGNQKLDYWTVHQRVQTKAYLNPGLTIELTDGSNSHSFQYTNGLLDYLNDFITGEFGDDEGVVNEDALTCNPIHIKYATSTNNLTLEVAAIWTDSTTDTVISFANGIFTRDGGTHVKGVDRAIVDSVRSTMESSGLKPKRMKIIPKDVREGLVVIVSAYITNPQFQGQTKDRLNNPEVEKKVHDIVKDELATLFSKDSDLINKISLRVQAAVRARVASRAASEAIKRSSPVSKVRLPGKLSDCSSTVMEDTELFIVEGDSAGGSAKQGRDRNTQAILPLRGKVLNCESSGLKKVLNNKELTDLTTAIGTGILEAFDINKLRYGKIIIMTDADTDGHHIATLLLTFFYRYMPGLIKDGRVYLAQPPLYKIVYKTKTMWALTEEDKDSILKSIKSKEVDITRFKGLGEMPPKVLFQTTMDPEVRELLRIAVDDYDECDFWIESLMGRDAEVRAELISMYAAEYVDG